MKRLTDGMKNEMHTINQRTESLYDQYMGNVLGDQYFYMLYRLNAQHGDELESYKVKLENFYSETDVKEQTFQDYTTWDYKEQDLFSQAREGYGPYHMERLSERKINFNKYT